MTPARLANLHFADMAGRGPTWGPTRRGQHLDSRAGLLPAGELLRERAEDLKAKLVVLDPLAAAWLGNENDRSASAGVHGGLGRVGAGRRECGVLVLAHEPKTRESGPAGSTDWEAAARAVWSLSKEKYGPEPKGKGRAAPPDDRPKEWKLALDEGQLRPAGGTADDRRRHETNHDSVRWRVDGPWDATEQQGGGSNANS